MCAPGGEPPPPDHHDAVAVIERALVVLRRSQQRRTLQRRATGGAPSTQAAVLQVLDVLEAASDAGRVMTVTAVADALGVDQPRATRLVAQAVDAGLVRRGADPNDGRRSILMLTAGGRRVLAAAHQTRRTAVQAALAGWSPEDRDTFARLLDAFVSGWERAARRQAR